MRSKSSHIGKHICVLAEDQKCTIEPSVPYSIELKPMHKVRDMWWLPPAGTVTCDSRDRNRYINNLGDRTLVYII